MKTWMNRKERDQQAVDGRANDATVDTARNDGGSTSTEWDRSISMTDRTNLVGTGGFASTSGHFIYPPASAKWLKVAVISSYVPQQCGIATFAEDLREALIECTPSIQVDVVAVSKDPHLVRYPDEVVCSITRDDWRSYLAAADFINLEEYDIVCLQHEFGLFGGPEGAYVVDMLRHVKVPVVTTLHTLLANPSTEYDTRTKELIGCSDTVVTLSKRGLTLLSHVYHAPMARAQWIPHGIPQIDYCDPAEGKERFGWNERNVLLTFGLIGPSKGIDLMLEALPAIVSEHPDALYVIAGATHPGVIAEHGESYRDDLKRTIVEKGLENHVEWIDRYMEDEELIELLKACDVYITPYKNRDQISSGTLAYAFGAGRPVVSTGYWNAVDLLSNGRGHLVEFNDPDAIAHAVGALVGDDEGRRAMSEKAYRFSRSMTWSSVAGEYCELFTNLSCRIPKIVSADQPWSGMATIVPTVTS